jgi:lipid-A-disaccharide synthase
MLSSRLTAELARGAVAIASTGTVTLECALFGVPTVALRKTSPITYHLAKRMVKVKHLAMPNLLANEAVYPEFIQDAATPENLAREAGDLLANAARRQDVQAKLRQVVASLGGPGASARAAAAVLDVFRTV